MKYLVVLFAFCVACALGGLTDRQKVKLVSYKNTCVTESGVNLVTVENAKKGKLALEDPKLQCFAACLLRHIGILDAEGVFHEDIVRAKLPAGIPIEKADAVINYCKPYVGAGDNLCQSGGALFACFLKTRSFNLL